MALGPFARSKSLNVKSLLYDDNIVHVTVKLIFELAVFASQGSHGQAFYEGRSC